MKPAKTFLAELAEQRWDDHRLYHHSRINQSLHLLSAMSFLTAYACLFVSPGVSWNIGREGQVYAFLQVPLWQKVNGVQLTADWSALAGVSWRF